MIDAGSLEYAQARLQSRHGQRADAASWQRLETALEFAALLDAARQSPLRPWVVGITGPTPDQIEAVLRGHWRGGVAELVGWMPRPWQPALAWCSVWPELPALQHLARHGAAAAWMHDDATLRSLCAVPAAERPAALAASLFAPLRAAWSAPDAMGPAWLAEWQRRLPCSLGSQQSLQDLLATLCVHGAAFAAAPPGPGGALRRSLQARLVLLLRRATLEPAAAFIHLALSALDFERLRGELLARALFAPAGRT